MTGWTPPHGDEESYPATAVLKFTLVARKGKRASCLRTGRYPRRHGGGNYRRRKTPQVAVIDSRLGTGKSRIVQGPAGRSRRHLRRLWLPTRDCSAGEVYASDGRLAARRAFGRGELGSVISPLGRFRRT